MAAQFSHKQTSELLDFVLVRPYLEIGADLKENLDKKEKIYKFQLAPTALQFVAGKGQGRGGQKNKQPGSTGLRRSTDKITPRNRK